MRGSTGVRKSRPLALALLVVLPLLVAAHRVLAAEESQPDDGMVTVHLFWTATCPHCAKARAFLERLALREPRVRLDSLELSGAGPGEDAFATLSATLHIDPPAVPLIIVGADALVGYLDDSTTGARIQAAVRACLDRRCADLAGPIIAAARQRGAEGSAGPPAGRHRGMRPLGGTVERPALPETIGLPGLGRVELRSLPLPALTVLLGAIDGFNPCAMWVLVLLIGLLVGTRDPVRMWAYGGAFLLTSGAVYFAFLAAWLNLFLLLGTLAWLRGAVGLFAIAAGAYYLREFFANREAACPVTAPGDRRRIVDRAKALVAERSFAAAIAGIMALAVVVNMIELLCSAGIPAVYTQVLALSELPAAAYYAYLLLYVAVFMLDDIAIFAAAMLTLRATGLATTYARWSHLVGGVALLCIGLLLALRPHWLAFG